MIVVDGVYSMEGNIADVPGLVRVARKYGAALALDDAHALGVLGPNGDGTAAHFGMIDEVDIIAGTFSKSLASIGGFVAASESVIHYLKHHSRPLIFTASLPPANTAGVLAALAGAAGRDRAPRPPVGQHPSAPGGVPKPGLRDRPHPDADRAGAHRPAGEDLPHVAPAVRCRRVHQPGRPARSARRPSAACGPASWRPTPSSRSTSLWSSSPASDGTWGSSEPSAPRPSGAGPTGPQALHRSAVPTARAGPDLGPAVASGRGDAPRSPEESLLRARRGRILPRGAGRNGRRPHRRHQQSAPQRDARRPGRLLRLLRVHPTTRPSRTRSSRPRPSGVGPRGTTSSADPLRSRSTTSAGFWWTASSIHPPS